MKKNMVKLGQTYAAKVSGAVVPVRLDKANPHGGWDGVSLKSGKPVRIKSPQRLRGLWPKKTLPVAKAADSPTTQPGAADGTPAKGAVAAAVLAKRRAAKASGKTATKAEAVDAAMQAVAKEKKERHSLLNLAAKVLAEAGEPLNCQQMVEKVLAAGLWKTEGKTPQATLYSAILREMQTKRDAARFRKVERGKFAAVRQDS